METSLLNPCISIYLSKQFWKEFRLRLEIFNRFSIFSSVQFSSSDHLIITSLIFIRIQSNQHGSSRFTMMNIWRTMNLMMIMMLMMMMMINGKWWMNDDVMMMTINMSDCCKLRPRLQKKLLWGPWRTSSCSPSRSWRALEERMSSDHHHHHHQRLWRKYGTMAHGHLCFAAFFTHISLDYSWLVAVRSFWDVRRETIRMSGRESV